MDDIRIVLVKSPQIESDYGDINEISPLIVDVVSLPDLLARLKSEINRLGWYSLADLGQENKDYPHLDSYLITTKNYSKEYVQYQDLTGEKLSTVSATYLSNGRVFQEVNHEFLKATNPKLLVKIEKDKKAQEERKRKAREKAEETKAIKAEKERQNKERQLAKAKQLLEEAGQL
jgi:ABC-type enterochelin transport system substrate-binding protein